MSSLCFSKGASMIFRREKVSDSISNVCPVKVAIRSQCLCFMALLAMSSRRGQLSLKSSIVFFKSKKACQSFKARGSLRQLEKETPQNKKNEQSKETLLKHKASTCTLSQKGLLQGNSKEERDFNLLTKENARDVKNESMCQVIRIEDI